MHPGKPLDKQIIDIQLLNLKSFKYLKFKTGLCLWEHDLGVYFGIVLCLGGWILASPRRFSMGIVL